MSNYTYGFIEITKGSKKENYLQILQEKTGIGITPISVSQLYNFPSNILPQNEEEFITFNIGDRPGSNTTSFLTDYIDYAPDDDPLIPSKGIDRLKMLLNLFMIIMNAENTIRLVVAITDSCQIEDVKTVTKDQMCKAIIRDFDEFAPPDRLYIITK